VGRASKNILTDFLKAALPELADEEFEELTIVDPPTSSGNSSTTSWKSWM
jgi:hypothetical protein